MWFRWICILFLSISCWQTVNGQVVNVTTEEYPPPGTITKDTLYYSGARKLQWQDFTGSLTPGSFSAAETMPGFSYDAASIKKGDTIFVRVYLQVYFVRNESWVLAGEGNDYALSHEQIHFDIAKIAEEQFNDSLLKKSFSAEYYPIEIHFLYWDFWRKMTDWEQQFDTETHHGMDRAKEALWAEKVRKSLLSGSDLN